MKFSDLPFDIRVLISTEWLQDKDLQYYDSATLIKNYEIYDMKIFRIKFYLCINDTNIDCAIINKIKISKY